MRSIGYVVVDCEKRKEKSDWFGWNLVGGERPPYEIGAWRDYWQEVMVWVL